MKSKPLGFHHRALVSSSLLISPRALPLHNLNLNVEREKFIYFHAYVPPFHAVSSFENIFYPLRTSVLFTKILSSNAFSFVKLSVVLPFNQNKRFRYLYFPKALFISHPVAMITESHYTFLLILGVFFFL